MAQTAIPYERLPFTTEQVIAAIDLQHEVVEVMLERSALPRRLLDEVRERHLQVKTLALLGTALRGAA